MVQLLRKTREESCLICCHVACEDKEKKRKKKELKNWIDLFDLPPQQKKSNKKLLEKNLYLFIDRLIDCLID